MKELCKTVSNHQQVVRVAASTDLECLHILSQTHDDLPGLVRVKEANILGQDTLVQTVSHSLAEVFPHNREQIDVRECKPSLKTKNQYIMVEKY